MKSPSRRTVLLTAGASALGLVAARFGLPLALRTGPPLDPALWSAELRALVTAAFAGLEPARVWDVHAHVVGLDGSSGGWVHPSWRSHAHPLDRLRFEIYAAAAGVTDERRADDQYVERLLALHRSGNPEGRLVALAFDQRVGEDGTELPDRSTFYMPNEHVLALARAHADVEACASIHPYRRDAVELLERVAEAGAVAVKWLPNAMGIDPASPRCDAFYARMAELGLPLLTHTGRELAVHAAEDQVLGNPLLLRRALDAGVRVIAAHCASLGRSLDLDADEPEERESFDLFLRLLAEEGPHGSLLGELSALTLLHRAGRPLRTLLGATELHPWLVNGSDWPLVAIDPLISLGALVRQGVLDEADRPALRELFEANPLLFDLVLKRRLRLVGAGGATHRFPASAFETARVLERA